MLMPLFDRTFDRIIISLLPFNFYLLVDLLLFQKSTIDLLSILKKKFLHVLNFILLSIINRRRNLIYTYN